jgi:hypothetical protein
VNWWVKPLVHFLVSTFLQNFGSKTVLPLYQIVELLLHVEDREIFVFKKANPLNRR